MIPLRHHRALISLVLAGSLVSLAAAHHTRIDEFVTMRRLLSIHDQVVGREAEPIRVEPAAGEAAQAVEPEAGDASREPRAGVELFYKNGQLATNGAGDVGAPWSYPNAAPATDAFGEEGAEWYWPNGQRATWHAGQVGAEWYYPNGQLATERAGIPHARWFYSDGRTMTGQGPVISADELLDVPKFMLFLLWMDGGQTPPF